MDTDLGGPDQLPPAKLGRGTRQTGVRLYNERLVLSLVRHHRRPAQGRHRPADRPLAADRLGDRRGARGRRAARPQGAAARPGRPALGAGLAQPRRRLLDRRQDRPAAKRHRADGLRRRCRGPSFTAPTSIRSPESLVAFIGEACAQLADELAGRHRGAGSPGSASPRRSSCGTGRRKSARRPARCRAGRASTCRAEVGRVYRPRRSSPATTRPPPARPSSCSATPAATPTCSTSSSPGSSAAASCSTATSSPAGPAMPARSARSSCRPVDADGQPTGEQLLHVASMYLLERADQGGRRRPVADLGIARRLELDRSRISTRGSTGPPRASPTRSSTRWR